MAIVPKSFRVWACCRSSGNGNFFILCHYQFSSFFNNADECYPALAFARLHQGALKSKEE